MEHESVKITRVDLGWTLLEMEKGLRNSVPGQEIALVARLLGNIIHELSRQLLSGLACSSQIRVWCGSQVYVFGVMVGCFRD